MIKKEYGDSGGASGGEWPPLCEACRAAPCELFCRADSAYLCSGCDAEIHSVNLLARRHHRVPVPSFPSLSHVFELDDNDVSDGKEEEEAASWLVLNNDVSHGKENNTEFLFGEEAGEYFELTGENSVEGVVPVQCLVNDGQQQVEVEGYEVGKDVFGYSASLGPSVSLPSIYAIPTYQARASKGTIDLFSGPPLQLPPQHISMDREAKVLRYREKRKTRKFEKTIRYATRKAYAETRPRIKGRFAKRSEVELEMDQMFSAVASAVVSEGAYGIVPTF